MEIKGLTLSLIVEAQSANYGDSIGNISTLKKMTRDDGNMYTYISRQALRYNLAEQMACNNTPVEAVGEGKKKVVQFAPSTTIAEYPEIDLFGYMKTVKGGDAKTRSAVVRLSHAISLEPYAADMDFLTNMGMAHRKNLDNNISQSEIHQSFYAYTITVDLDRVGVEREIDGTITMEISGEEKAKRIQTLLQAVQFLYRDIKGRRENLAPVFAIGGLYNRKNPFFENRLKMNRGYLQVDTIQAIVDSSPEVADNTSIGYVEGFFRNEDKIRQLKPAPVGMSEFFTDLNGKVGAYYSESSKA